jgi:lysophospholipase L1-like esterase
MTASRLRSPGARVGICLAVLILLERCSGTTPTAPPPPPISVICPTNLSAQVSQGQTTVTVVYSPPGVSGGKAPVTTSCTPASGTSFSIGTTPVSCTVSDAALQSVGCTFSVSVAAAPVPRLSATSFMAFGDSLTEGKTTLLPDMVFETSYTLKLQAQLQARYTSQSVVVVNEGLGGENAIDGVNRFHNQLLNDKPQVVLLMEGANDLLQFGATGIAGVITAVDRMGIDATGRGAQVFLATLPPADPRKVRGSGGTFVPALNAQLTSLATARQWTLVDVNAAFKGDLTLLGPDGLHPTDAGHQVIAKAFYDRIVARLELPPAAGLLGLR